MQLRWSAFTVRLQTEERLFSSSYDEVFQHSYSAEQPPYRLQLTRLKSKQLLYLENWKQSAQTNWSLHIVKTRGVFRTQSNILDVGYPLSMYAEFSEKLTFLLNPDTRTYVCYQGVRNVSFSENFVHVLNGRQLQNFSHRNGLIWNISGQ